MMNEIRNILIGFEFGAAASQICYYDRQEEDAKSLPVQVGQTDATFHNCISTADGSVWHFGPEAEFFSRQKGETMVDNLYELCQGHEKTLIAGVSYAPGELLAIFIREALTLLGVREPVKKISSFMLTTPKISRVFVENVRVAYSRLGFAPERCSVQEYEESFYFETFSGRTDTRGRKVGLFIFAGSEVSFAKLDVDQKTRPAIVTYTTGRRTVLSEDPGEKDREFYTLITESLGSDTYSTIYLVGEGFDQSWAGKSVALLCKGQRKVFYGDNLYAKGACQAARERVEDRRLKSYLYVGSDMVRHNVGMDMVIGGVSAYYPLVIGGVNWYDVSVDFELILDGENSLRLQVSELNAKEKQVLGMKLPGLPERPPKATRLAVHLEYISAKQMKIVVKDLGFGDLYPSSGKVWEETLVG